MALYIAHALRRSNRIHFPDYAPSIAHTVQRTELIPPCTSRSHSQARFLHLQRCSQISQILRNPHFAFFSPASLKLESDLCSWNSGQVRVNFCSKPHKDKPVSFMDSDKCMIFDSGDAQVSHVTFAEACVLANKNKCRLVYMNKNRDGIFCFKLQTFTDAMGNLMLDSTSSDSPKLRPPEKPQNEKPQKSSEKEFKIHSSISDHDFTIKLKKMRALLDKGKKLMVLINGPESSPKDNTAVLVKKLTEDLEDICKVKHDAGKKGTTKLSLMPKEKV